MVIGNLFSFWEMPFSGATVDGSEIRLTSWYIENLPFIAGFYTYQMVQDYFHQQYVREGM